MDHSCFLQYSPSRILYHFFAVDPTACSGNTASYSRAHSIPHQPHWQAGEGSTASLPYPFRPPLILRPLFIMEASSASVRHTPTLASGKRRGTKHTSAPAYSPFLLLLIIVLSCCYCCVDTFVVVVHSPSKALVGPAERRAR